MWHGCGEYAVVKRFGRYATDTVQDYLWEFHERQKGLAGTMVENDFELTAPTAKLPTKDVPKVRKVKFQGRTQAGQGVEVQFSWLGCQTLLFADGLACGPVEDFLCERC